MTITRKQVADLQPGDVVELTSTTWPDGAIRGRLFRHELYKSLVLNSPRGEETYVIRDAQGDPPCPNQRTLTVVSRAPRPLYVNHPRTEPVAGDVVRIEFPEGAEDDACIDVYLPTKSRPHDPWLSIYNSDAGVRYPTDMVIPGRGNNARGRAFLLVDGETGQAVPR